MNGEEENQDQNQPEQPQSQMGQSIPDSQPKMVSSDQMSSQQEVQPQTQQTQGSGWLVWAIIVIIVAAIIWLLV